MDEPGIQWREGKPDYTKVNKAYLEGRTQTHKEGSLEKIVEDLVKTWEMEASHKTRIEVYQSQFLQFFLNHGHLKHLCFQNTKLYAILNNSFEVKCIIWHP